MPHVLIRLDTPLHYDARPGPAGPTRLISAPVGDKIVNGGPDRRSYYNAAGPYRLLISCPQGHMPAILAASQGDPAYPQTYARAILGFIRPTANASKPDDTGHQHRHIAILELVTTEQANEWIKEEQMTVYGLAHLLDNAPRSDKKGGARSELVGASLRYGQEMHRTTVRIPGPMMETLTAMPSAEGKFPKAVRDLGHFYTANPGAVRRLGGKATRDRRPGADSRHAGRRQRTRHDAGTLDGVSRTA